MYVERAFSRLDIAAEDLEVVYKFHNFTTWGADTSF